jgi:hypothetical protein
MIVGYARVSTDGQSLEAQDTALRTEGAERLWALSPPPVPFLFGRFTEESHRWERPFAFRLRWSRNVLLSDCSYGRWGTSPLPTQWPLCFLEWPFSVASIYVTH